MDMSYMFFYHYQARIETEKEKGKGERDRETERARERKGDRKIERVNSTADSVKIKAPVYFRLRSRHTLNRATSGFPNVLVSQEKESVSER